MKAFFILSLLIVHANVTGADFVVAPNDRASQAGNNFVLDGFQGPRTYQMVYGARNFTGPVLITGLAFRTDEDRNGISSGAQIPKLTIQLTTYSGTYASFNSNSYLANATTDNTTVFESPITWSSTDLGGNSPNPFDLEVHFSQPFRYDPSHGPLLMNYTASGPFSSLIAVDSQGHNDNTIGWLGFSGPFGGTSLQTLVTRFEVTSIPEPGVDILLLGGLVPVLRFLTKK